MVGNDEGREKAFTRRLMAFKGVEDVLTIPELKSRIIIKFSFTQLQTLT